MEYVIIRPPLVYGSGVRANFLNLLKLVHSHFPLPLASINNKRSLLALDNLVAFIGMALVHDKAANEIFLVSDGIDVSTPQLINKIAAAFNQSPRLFSFPSPILKGLASVVGKQAAFERLQSSLQLDISKAVELLAWQPPVSQEDAIKQTADSFIKRLFDLVVVVLVFPLALTIMLLIALGIVVTSPGPVIFWSDRVGKNNVIFRMPKFRTMKIDTPNVATHLLDNPDQYLTSVGKLLRRTSLDELPQLWSVLKSDMSLVGPRPALFNQDDLIKLRTENNVHKLVPGLTGWAQINGRDELPIPEKVELDKEYLDRQSFWFDLKIIMLTIIRVFSRHGISH